MIHESTPDPRSTRGASSRAVLFLVAGLAILVALVLVLLRDTEAGPASATGLDRALAPTPGVAPELTTDSVTSPLAHDAGADTRLGGVAVGVRLTGPGRLTGRVVDRASGAGVGGVRLDLLPVPPAGQAFLGRMLRLTGMGEEMGQRVRPAAVAESGADGEFRFQGVRQGTYYLDARGEYHVAESVVRARVLASGSGGPIEVFVQPGGRVLGRVLRPDGRPAKDATLALVSGIGNFLTNARTGDLRWLETTSAADGSFLFGGVAPGEGYEITASGSGFALSHALDIAVVAGRDTEVVVQTRSGGTVVGRVMTQVEGHEPTPLAGAHLGAVPRGLRSLRCVEEILTETHCVTQADGRYVMTHVPPGDVDLLAIAWEHLPAVGAHVALGDAATVEAPDIQLSKGPMVRGRVLDTAGQPIPGVTPRWNLVDWKNFQFDFSFAPLMMAAVKGLDLPKTDAEGRFWAGPIAGKPDYSIDFTKTGFVDQEFKWNPERDGAEITVTLRRGSAVEGVVMDALKAEPVPSFTVTGADRVDTEPEAPGSKNPFSGGLLVEDPAGRFRIESVKPGKSSLTFTAPGYLPRTVEDIAVDADKPTRGLIVKLTPGGVARGVVVDPKGNPVTAAQVLVAPARGGLGSVMDAGRERRGRGRGFGPRGPFGDMGNGAAGFPPGMMVYAASMGLLGDKVFHTDAAGKFEIRGIEPGTFKVIAFHRDHTAGVSAENAMGEAGLVEGIVVQLPQGGGIQGVVHDRHGRPVAGELVLAFSPQGFDPSSNASSGAGLYQGRSNDQGAYEIKNVAAGSYFLVATRGDEDLNPTSFFGTMNFDLVTVPPGEIVPFDLVDSSAGACRVFGRVTYKGEPAPRGNLSAVNFETDNLLGIEFKAAKMGDGGKFEFAGLAPGDYQLNFDGPGGQVRLSLEVPDQAELEVNLALPEGGVEGRVLDESTNQPIEGADVTLRSTSAPKATGLLGQFLSREGRAGRKTTNEKGEFVFDRLEGGEYELSVRGPRRGDTRGKYAPADPARVRVLENRVERDVVVRLQPALTLSGVVVDERKTPIPNATVLVNLEKGTIDTVERARSDEQGRFEVLGLAPGAYKATASVDGFADGTTTGIRLVRDSARPVECEIVLRKGVRVVVRVFGANGAPASGARADLYPLKGEKSADPANAGKAIQNLFTGEGASDATGRIDLGRYLPGEYRLEVQRGFSKATDPKVKLAGNDEEVELRIDLP